MRFVKVALKNFQGLESAEVEFGPGLNVVFGPNDFGKSTLASAIRAALLVPPASSEADRYTSWFADAAPEVTLTFLDDDKRFWKVRKTFGAQASADLFHSKDGLRFDRDAGGREVEDKLRRILAWGIPSPGGKGAPRRLPTSFLAQVLLAEQTAVQTLFQQSTEDDAASSGEVKSKAERARAEVTNKARAGEKSEAAARETSAEAKALASLLPEPALAQGIEALSQRIAIAEAALGGGFSVTIRGSGKVPVYATPDGETRVAGTVLDGSVVVEANRTLALRLGDLLDLEIIAGAAEKRHELARLREEWSQMAEPILRAAGVSTGAELRARLDDLAALDARAEKLENEARQLRQESEAARQTAELLEQRSEELLGHSRDAEALRAKLSERDTAALGELFAKLGADWKAQAEKLLLTQEQALSGARTKLESARRDHDQSSFRARDLETRSIEAEADEKRRRVVLGLADGDAGDPTPLTRALAEASSARDALLSRQAAIASELSLLDQHASSAVAEAHSAVQSAKTARENVLEELTRSIQALEEARSQFHTTQGEVATLRAALASEDRTGATARWADARRELERYANDPVVTAEHVAAAEQREITAKATQERVRGELQHAEGALTKVGGPAAEEALRREDEALTLARERQVDLEIEADSWKLLHETLEAAEKEGSTHLGRSLAAPVSARFSELTQARYNAIRIDQHLKVETVDVSLVNVENALDELSIGTRDQLATLLRLTIAEQLKSAVVLDDHLVHTDSERLAWFKSALRSAALNTQVIVISCRPQDYLTASELPSEAATRDLAGGAVRGIDFARLSTRFAPTTPFAPQRIRATRA